MAHGDITKAGFATFTELISVNVALPEEVNLLKLGADIAIPKYKEYKLFTCNECGNLVVDIFKHELFYHR